MLKKTRKISVIKKEPAKLEVYYFNRFYGICCDIGWHEKDILRIVKHDPNWKEDEKKYKKVRDFYISMTTNKEKLLLIQQFASDMTEHKIYKNDYDMLLVTCENRINAIFKLLYFP